MNLSILSAGLVSGLLYALTAMGLVVVYRTSRVLNFALGGIGGVSTYIGWKLLEGSVPYAVVFIAVIVVGAVLGVVVDFAVTRSGRLRGLSAGVGTLGALLILQGTASWIWGNSTRAVPVPLASAGGIHIGTLVISGSQLLTIAIVLVAGGMLILLLTRTRLGLAMEATASGPQTASLLGINVGRVREFAWAIGGGLGALAAMLVIPTQTLTPTSFTSFLLVAFAAVVIGGFTSLPGVALGGIVFGIGTNLLATYLSPAYIESYTFVAVMAVLLLRPHGLFGAREYEIAEPRIAPPTSPVAMARRSAEDRRLARGAERGGRIGESTGWLGLLALATVIPFFVNVTLVSLLASSLAVLVAVVGLNVLTGYCGQLSIGNSAFVAIGAYTAGILGTKAGIPFALEFPAALVVGATVGAVIGLPAARLGGLYLALLTLLFSFAVPEVLLRWTSLTGGALGLAINSPSWLHGVADQYWFCLGVASLAIAATLVAARTRLGRGWVAVRDSPDGARALGLNPAIIKVGAFAWSAGFAGLSGALSATLVGYLTTDTYTVWLSIYLLVAVIVGGSGSLFGSVIGAIFITVLPYYISQTSVSPDVLLGAAMLVVLTVAPGGVGGALAMASQRVLNRWARRNPRLTEAPRDESSPVLSEPPGSFDILTSTLSAAMPEDAMVSPASPLLTITDLSAGYGFVQVLHRVTLHVQAGEVVTLIGANGSGKSTLLRTVSGLLRPVSGSIEFHGTELTGHAPHAIAAMGLAHVPEGRGIFPGLSVAENLEVGLFARSADTENSPGFDRDDALELFPKLRTRLKQRAGTLSGGEQQMLAIARGLLARPRLLMLDEPSLGLAPKVVVELFESFEQIAQTGVSILLIEQNAHLALETANRAYVLVGGRVAVQGEGAGLLHDVRLVDAYLGARP